MLENNLFFLAEAGKILSSSLDYKATLASVAHLVVSSIADFCIIDLITDNNQMQRVAVADIDPDKNKIAQEMFKYPPDPKVREAIYDVARSGKPILKEKASKQWLQRVSHYEGELRIIHELGLNSHVFVPLISRGKTIGVLTFASRDPDFSYDEDDVALAQELASRAAIAVDNARLYQEAQDAIRVRDEFLSIASHELKTPLTSILLQIQALLSSIKRNSGEINEKRLIALLESTETQSKKLSKLITDLLNVSLVSTGRMQLLKEEVDLVALTKEILGRFKVELKKRKYTISTDFDKQVIGKWDHARIEQVVSNLITNAMKYGEGKPITIKVKKSDSTARFMIEDQGIGIAKDYQKQIFDRFSRGVSAKEYRGLGVGLYISRQIVEAHKGKITLESKENEGSRFSIELPL